MHQTRFCGEISLVSLSHHRIYAFDLANPVMHEISPISPPEKKFVSIPCTFSVFNAVILLFIAIFVGWDALAKARRGKEKNRSKKRALLDRHLGS